MRHVFLVSSGSAALALALTALKSQSTRTEVVIPAYTCFSLPAAILKAGLRPVPCDIDPVTFDFDHALLRQTMSPGGRSASSGITCSASRPTWRGCARSATRTAAFLIEDAAQAMGVELDGRKLGTIGRYRNLQPGPWEEHHVRIGRHPRDQRDRHRRGDRPRVSRDCRCLAPSRALKELVAARADDPVRDDRACTGFRRRCRSCISGETLFPKDVPVERLSGMKAGLLRGWKATARRVEPSAVRNGQVLQSPPAASPRVRRARIRICGCRSG